MSGIRYQPVAGLDPKHLTPKELVHYAWVLGPSKLDEMWIKEILKRLEEHLDDGR